MNPAKRNKGTRAAIYTRISRDKKEGGGLGVERQLAACKNLAVSLNVSIVGEYSDNDISAFSGKRRPGYDQMLSDIAAGGIDVVLAWHTDRLHRRTLELERYIQVCEPHQVGTHTVQAGKLDLSTPSGRMNAKILGNFAQYESEHKGERIREQKAQAANKGKFLGGRVPYGWRSTKAGIAVEPLAGELIQAGTRAIINGRSLIGVTRDWSDAGALSLSGTRMNTTQVRRVLLRPRNAGLMTFHGEIVSDQWPAIVTLDEFRKCEAILTDSSRPKQSESKFKYLLSGVAQCFCGRTMTGFGVDGRRSYRCKVHQEGGKYVRGHAQRAMQPLDHYVMTVAETYLRRPGTAANLRAALAEHDSAEEPVSREDVAALIDRKHALARLFAQGSISESQLTEGSKEIESKLARLEDRAVANGGTRGVAAIALSEDPAGSFLAADVDVQREILRSLFTIELRPTGPYKGSFDASSVRMSPKD
ncbi:recombinase family protein [Pseudarthrobacter siccitolerans]